jgi:hypothetical protein
MFKGGVYRIKKEIRLRSRVFLERQKILRLAQKFNVEFKQVITKYENSSLPTVENTKPIIWFMWWQGKEAMPDVIQINYNALQHNLNGYEIVFLNKNNFQQYLELPQFVWDKLESGIISITHLSDLIRASVLYQYGGLWLDATIHVTAPLPNYMGLTYWSPKWQINRSEKRKYKLWYGLWALSNVPKLTITQCMGTWYSTKDNPIFGCLRDFWLSYWEKNDGIPYYWTTEVFLLGCMYSKIPSVKQQIDDLEFNNPSVFNISVFINKEINRYSLKELLMDTQYFYLRWKSQYLEYDMNNKKTLYSHLLEDSLYLNKLSKSFS